MSYRPRKRKLFIILQLLVSLCLFPPIALTQEADLPLRHELYDYLDRIDIMGLTDTNVFTANKPYNRTDIANYLAAASQSSFSSHSQSWHARMRRLADDEYADTHQGMGVWNTFFINKRDFYVVKQPQFSLYINPIVYGHVGREQVSQSEGHSLLRNSRGAVVRGSLMKKIGFYTEVYDTQSFVPDHLETFRRNRGTLPGRTFIKSFGSRKNGYDFLSAKAYFTFQPIKAIRIKFGKDRAFWGEGRQSLWLSDAGPDHLMLNIQTRIWKLVYTNHFGQYIDFVRNKGVQEGVFPKKYGVFHQLSFIPNKNLRFSLFESIIYTPNLANGLRGFELEYLNPIIFYRSAEQSIGSPDNGTLGISAKVNFFKRFSAYGQLFIDDYNFGVRGEGDNYWGNKVGYQLGLKYINAFNINRLDLQFEYNLVRPYTYQHFNASASYGHYGQSLGHFEGANLSDFFVRANYQALPQLKLQLSFMSLKQGLDEDGINYGSDFNISYQSRAGDFDQAVGQGKLLNQQILEGLASWQLWETDMFVELRGQYRRESGTQTAWLTAGFRAYIPSDFTF